MRILIIEDEKKLSDNIKIDLAGKGYAVDQAFDGEEGQFLGETEPYDLIILDLNLPRIDGISVCQNLRTKGIKTPVLMLTARSQTRDKVAGLDSGADDYLAKPFEFSELNARISALIRRSLHQPASVIAIGNLNIDVIRRVVERGTRKISLTPKEFSILEYLARHKDEVVTRTQLIEHTWDYNFDSMSNVVDVFVAALRKKIDKDEKKKLIKTIHGVGYEISEN